MVIAFQGASLQSSSAEFELLTAAKFGAGWAEEVKFVPPSSFVIRMRIRQTCGLGIYGYLFARQGQFEKP